MREEAASAGFFQSEWGKHPRLQLLTVAELFAGQTIDYPHVTGVDVTFKPAPKAKKLPRSFHQDLFAKGPLAGTPLSRQRDPGRYYGPGSRIAGTRSKREVAIAVVGFPSSASRLMRSSR